MSRKNTRNLPFGRPQRTQQSQIRAPQDPEQLQRLPDVGRVVSSCASPDILVESLNGRAGRRQNQTNPVRSHQLVVGQMGHDFSSRPLSGRRTPVEITWGHAHDQRRQLVRRSGLESQRVHTRLIAQHSRLVLRLGFPNPIYHPRLPIPVSALYVRRTPRSAATRCAARRAFGQRLWTRSRPYSYASTDGHEHIRFRSPYVLSIRATNGQNLWPRTQGAGNAACSRL